MKTPFLPRARSNVDHGPERREALVDVGALGGARPSRPCGRRAPSPRGRRLRPPSLAPRSPSPPSGPPGAPAGGALLALVHLEHEDRVRRDDSAFIAVEPVLRLRAPAAISSPILAASPAAISERPFTWMPSTGCSLISSPPRVPPPKPPALPCPCRLGVRVEQVVDDLVVDLKVRAQHERLALHGGVAALGVGALPREPREELAVDARDEALVGLARRVAIIDHVLPPPVCT